MAFNTQQAQDVTESLERAYTSMSGVDMKLTVANTGKVLSNVQGFSVSVTREKAPIYTLGGADPRSFSRGKRAIVGSIVLVLFDRSVLSLPTDQGGFAGLKAYLDSEEGVPGWTSPETDDTSFSVDESIDILNPVQSAEPYAGFEGSGGIPAYQWKNAGYMDQIPPLNLIATAANEYGNRSKMGVVGLEFLNEGMGFSIDDIQTNMQYTYVCRGLLPWTAVSRTYAKNPML